MTIGEKIAKLRKQAGMSQEVFSEKLDVSRQAVSKWENDTAQPTNENLSQIAKLFNVTISYLLDDEDADVGGEFSTTERENVKNDSEAKAERKAFKVASVMQSGAIVVLAIGLMVQSITISNLRKDIDALRQKADQISTLKSQIALVESRVDYTPATSNDNFTDYNYKVTAYDCQTNTATIQFSVVPKDYSTNTTAEIVVVGDKTYSLPAVFENNIFTAQAELKCDGPMTVYLYLTEDGKTRSFVLGGLPDIAKNYRLEVYHDHISGQWKIGNGYFKGDVAVACRIYYIHSQSLEDCVYPQKAVINIYCDDKLIYQKPFTSITEHDFIEEAKISAGDVAEIFSNVATFYDYFHVDIKDESITEKSRIWTEIVLADNNGYEYTVTQSMIEPANN